jgi:DNA repair protein RadC
MAFRIPAYRVELVRTHSVVSEYRFCSGPEQAVELFTRAVGDPDREHLVAMYLDAKMRFVGIHIAAVGQIAEMQVAPAEVFKAALLCNAAAVVIAHNHPSGDTLPSESDVDVTADLELAGAQLGVFVLDHLVIGRPGDYVSLRELDRMLIPPDGVELENPEMMQRWRERFKSRSSRPPDAG